jgi:flagellar hook-associated protein 2
MADTGALSSLGIGSGVLTYDVIDKLKKADEATMIDPFKTRLTNTQNREKSLNDLITQISLFKTSFADFKDGDIFQKRLTDVTGSSVSATANDGVKVQDITMDVKQLAKNDIYQSKGYDSQDSVINDSGSDQTITIGYGDQSQDITIQNGATLSDLRDAINNADIGITASIIDTGSDDNPYKLILKGNETGKDNTIKLDYHNIDDLQLNDINYQSKAYDSEDDSVTDTDTTFKVTINGEEHSIDVAANTSVKDFIDQINNDLGDSGITASYNSDTGKIEMKIEAVGDISIDEGDLNTDFNGNTDFTNDNRVQTAQNSEFTYNGVDVERDSNKIEDLVVGLTMNLNSLGESTIHIKQDTDTINKEVQDFVNGYNSLVSKIQDLTKYDPDNKTTGVFQNEMSIKNIPNDISGLLFNSFTTQTVTKTDRNGMQYDETINLNASDFGFTTNKTGFLEFDSSKFDDMLKNNPNETEKFFSDDTNGAFTKILDYIDNLTNGDHSTLELLNQQYKNEEKSYQNTIDSNQARIDAKYQTMAMQFASYDEMINSYNVQAQTIQQSIEAMINAKK